IGVVGTSIGLVAPMIARFFGELFNIPVTMNLLVMVIVLWTVMFGGRVYLGLAKGIKRRSDFNIMLVVAITIFVFLVGRKLFMLDNTIQSIGVIFNNLSRIRSNVGVLKQVR